jgi:predicted O-linked N-acetylglucosamine transferase (SPINDLY family)
MFRRVLSKQPNHPDALHMLGVMAYQIGRHQAAAELIGRAIAIRPLADYYGNLGLALCAQNKLRPAIDAFRAALQIAPDYPEALNNLGNALQQTGQPRDAIPLYQRALKLQPGFSRALNGLGNAFQMVGEFDQAMDCYNRALALSPNIPEIYNNLGNVHYLRGQWDAAIEVYRKAVELRTDYPDVFYNLGNALQMKGELAQAINNYRQALALRPNYPEALNNLGNTLRRENRLEDAIDCFQNALALRPDFVDSLNNLASAFKDLGELDRAIETFDRALAIEANSPAIASNRIYALTFHPRYDAAALLAEHKKWNQRYAQPLKASIIVHENDFGEDRRLRVGYISPDFRGHVIGQNLLPLLREHDHKKFEIFCYANVLRSDLVTAKFQSYADAWRNIVGVENDKAAEIIRRDKIDILVDLSLHMANNRMLVFARKPAPVQITFGGYPGTTGLETIDARLSDPYLDPPELDGFYSEKTVRIADSFWCYDPEAMDVATAPPPGPLPALQRGYVTFGCLNNFCKINDGVLELWARVLREVPESRLLLLAPEGKPRQSVAGKMWQEGIDASRVEFVIFQPRKEYLETYQQIDLGLDTLPYNGHTTSLDSLWMGVPVISLIGKTVVGRAGWSQLCNLNLKELAAQTPEQFVKIAADLATDLPRLAELRANLRKRMQESPLTDAPRFARNIESVYENIWQQWRRKHQANL